MASAVAATLAPLVASAQTKIYPPGTDCANQPTIAERLLCGRQEFRRQQGVSVEQPTQMPPPPAVDEDRPFPDQPTPPPVERAPVQDDMLVLPRTSSPNN